jgi:acyl dehydratase
VRITQDRIDAFVACTLDDQWIHVDQARAATGPFGTTIAPGFLTLSMLSYFMADLLVVDDAAMAINYGLNRVRFPATVAAESQLRATLEICSVTPSDTYTMLTGRMTFQADSGAKPCCVADMVTRFVHTVAGARG